MYQPRILVDNNENGIWDSSDFSTGTFAEDVFLNPKKIEVRPLWEIRENWNLNEKIAPPSSEKPLPEAIPTITSEKP